MTTTDIRSLLVGRKKPVLSREGALNTGSTLLNLACTDHPDFGFLKGSYYYLVGDSMSGKTFTSLSCFAEACRNEAFDRYRLIFDDVEGGALMDIKHYFGREVAKRLESPAVRNSRSVCSDTIESFYYHITDLLRGPPFIYVLDSQDSLTSKASTQKFLKQKRASEEGEMATGSYGDGKAKYHSEHIREVLAGLRKTQSILIIIGQTRDNLGMSFEKKTRSGGRALRFYANLEIWTSVIGKIRKLVRGTKRTVGVKCLAEVKKNRVTGKVGKDRSALIPIYYDYGIDDIGSCIDFLIAEKHWPRVGKGIYEAHDVLFQGSRNAIIGHVEEEDLEDKVRHLTAKVWGDIEEESRPKRKRRYT